MLMQGGRTGRMEDESLPSITQRSKKRATSLKDPLTADDRLNYETVFQHYSA